MIFSDEPRSVTANGKGKRGKIYGLVPQTDGNVGPGTYFLDRSASSNTWIKKSFSDKQPMSCGPKTDRTHYYTSGHLTSLGMVHPASPRHGGQTPGPGYYCNTVNSPSFSPRPRSAQKRLGSSSSKMLDPRRRSVDGTSFAETNRERYEGGFGTTSVMGTSPRLTYENTVIKNGVMFHGGTSNSKNSPFGPGYYFTEKDSFNKRSFNVRCATPKNHAGAMPNSPANNANSIAASISGNTKFARSSSRMSNGGGRGSPGSAGSSPAAWHQDVRPHAQGGGGLNSVMSPINSRSQQQQQQQQQQHLQQQYYGGEQGGYSEGAAFSPIGGDGGAASTGPITLEMLAPHDTSADASLHQQYEQAGSHASTGSAPHAAHAAALYPNLMRTANVPQEPVLRQQQHQAQQQRQRGASASASASATTSANASMDMQQQQGGAQNVFQFAGGHHQQQQQQQQQQQ